MNAMELLDAIGDLDEELIREARERKKRKRPLRGVIGTLAAACIAAVIVLPVMKIVFTGAGTAMPESSASGTAGPTADGASGAVDESAGTVYIRAEIKSDGKAWSITDAGRLAKIGRAVDAILMREDTEASDSHGRPESESVVVNTESRPQVDSAFTLIRRDGTAFVFTLSGGVLTDEETGKEYPLSDTELAALSGAITEKGEQK